MKKLRILVVDDEEAVLRACARALSDIPNAEVIAEQRSPRAAELLAEQSFDLLVSDIRMPEMDGEETTRRIRAIEARRGGMAPTPIIALSANAFAVNKSACRAAGMTDFLGKPFTARQLVAALMAATRRSEAVTSTSFRSSLLTVDNAWMSPVVPARREPVMSEAWSVSSKLSASLRMPLFSRSSNGRVVEHRWTPSTRDRSTPIRQSLDDATAMVSASSSKLQKDRSPFWCAASCGENHPISSKTADRRSRNLGM